MSQMRVTLPITVNTLDSESGEVERVSDEYVVEESGDEQYRFVQPEHLRYAPGPEGPEQPSTYGPFDPWKLRTDFLGWKLREWKSFFVMAGPFGTESITRNDFEEWQRLIRAALVAPARKWNTLADEFDPSKVEMLLGVLPIHFDWDSEPPTATLVGETPLNSMIASLQLDKLQGAEFRICARPDCESPPFRVGTRQKIYCDSSCAHVVAVRNSRDRIAYGSKPKRQKKRGNTSPG